MKLVRGMEAAAKKIAAGMYYSNFDPKHIGYIIHLLPVALL